MIDVPPQNMRIIKWEGDYYVNARTLGNRNVGIDPVEKYSRDAEVLHSALNNAEDPHYEPNNVRYQFILLSPTLTHSSGTKHLRLIRREQTWVVGKKRFGSLCLESQSFVV